MNDHDVWQDLAALTRSGFRVQMRRERARGYVVTLKHRGKVAATGVHATSLEMAALHAVARVQMAAVAAEVA